MRALTVLAVMIPLLSLEAYAKDPALGATTYVTYESFLSPAQEPGEESETPKLLQKSLGATAPSIPREERKSRGHGQLRFSRDMSRAYVEVEIQGVNPADILMFHIHCGPPGFLGPIIVDFGEVDSPSKLFSQGKLVVELTNKNVRFVKDMPGLKPSLPESCPSDIGLPNQTRTLSGLEYLARKGVLYFNLHTKAHTYYGEMRGQLSVAQD
ncbi:CHRD domain-containing protein [Corallococcus sp. H22C18031201]|uniref:CHRD domain-containing protein n=1 Tax=Citreicoccus inhibens TaxID=2849499 RepID=UPI000E737CF5|nr:CHRD domain-containing protein [Citreicoccus inhibens]MBU8899113.1 CHRD domain-containing protein [Citreicoccus inhibens]RJS14525.1 CHRD domain-containing protein [Corallococcus sp. H22C18031201]